MAEPPAPSPRRTPGRTGTPGRGTASESASETDLGDLVMRVARALRHRGAQAMAPWDIAPHHARALTVIGHHDGVRPGELAAHLRVAPRSVTDVVDALEERGLVAREPDPTDRRATVLALTASGRWLVKTPGFNAREEQKSFALNCEAFKAHIELGWFKHEITHI